MNQLKKELEGVIGGLNERLGELQNLARKQQAKVVELEKERDHLEDELTKRDDMEGNVDLLQRQLDGEMQLVVSNQFFGSFKEHTHDYQMSCEQVHDIMIVIFTFMHEMKSFIVLRCRTGFRRRTREKART